MYDPVKRKDITSRDVIFDEQSKWSANEDEKYGLPTDLVYIPEHVHDEEVKNRAMRPNMQALQVKEQLVELI